MYLLVCFVGLYIIFKLVLRFSSRLFSQTSNSSYVNPYYNERSAATGVSGRRETLTQSIQPATFVALENVVSLSELTGVTTKGIETTSYNVKN
jgi:hypothetical protein